MRLYEWAVVCPHRALLRISSILSTSIIPSRLSSLPTRRTGNVKACGLVGVAVLKAE